MQWAHHRFPIRTFNRVQHSISLLLIQLQNSLWRKGLLWVNGRLLLHKFSVKIVILPLHSFWPKQILIFQFRGVDLFLFKHLLSPIVFQVNSLSQIQCRFFFVRIFFFFSLLQGEKIQFLFTWEIFSLWDLSL